LLLNNIFIQKETQIMGIGYVSTIIINASTEETQQIVEFIKADSSIIDFGKIMGIPESLRKATFPTGDMSAFVNWICRIDNASHPFSNMEMMPYMFSTSEWGRIREMIINLKLYGSATYEEWLYRQYGVDMDASGICFVDGKANEIKVGSRNGNIQPVAKALSQTFPQATIVLTQFDDCGDMFYTFEFQAGKLISQSEEYCGSDPIPSETDDQLEIGCQIIF
jgi:hypothetical protein